MGLKFEYFSSVIKWYSSLDLFPPNIKCIKTNLSFQELQKQVLSWNAPTGHRWQFLIWCTPPTVHPAPVGFVIALTCVIYHYGCM